MIGSVWQKFKSHSNTPMTLSEPTVSKLTKRDLSLGLFLALLLFGIYMLTFDGTLHSTDGLSMLAVTENVVKHGRFDTRQLENWENVYPGLDGRPYTNFALGPTLLMIPLFALALVLPHLGLTQTTMLLMPLAGALSAIYLYLSARRLGYGPKIGATAALLAGLATLIWPQLRDLVAEPLMVFSFMAAFYYALAYRQDRKITQAGLLGLALGLAVLHKLVNVVAVPLFWWYMLDPVLKPGHLLTGKIGLTRKDWLALGTATGVLSLSLGVIGLYNTARFGSPLDSGYPFLFSTPVWLGLSGFLISPYKSLFLYTPLFILIPFTILQTWRQHRSETILILSLLAIQMVIFAAWYDWGGGKSWGPRFLVPLYGLLTLLLLPYLALAFQPGRWRYQAGLIILSALSLVIQILGLFARDDPFLNSNYWSPAELSLWGDLSWSRPGDWPIWGHLLRFDWGQIPVIWQWQWAEYHHFELVSLVAALVIVGLGLGGVVLLAKRDRAGSAGRPVGAWLIALGCAGLILWRNYDDPRSIKMVDEAAALWPAYSKLAAQLPDRVSPTDVVIFTDRRFEFYLLDLDKSPAQRYVIAKDTQPRILETVPKLLQERPPQGRIWLVTDDLDNRQLAYATELWLQARARPVEHTLFGPSVQLTAFEPQPSATWPPIPLQPRLTTLVDPHEYKFNGIAALLGWRWPGLDGAASTALPAGQTHDFELYWIYRGKSPDDHFFVRLLDKAGHPVVEAIPTPRPGQHLIPGQLLIEDASLILPPDLPPGTYHLQIGFTIPVVEAGELVFPLPPELTGVQVKTQPGS